jgi:hypothetical protein
MIQFEADILNSSVCFGYFLAHEFAGEIASLVLHNCMISTLFSIYGFSTNQNYQTIFCLYNLILPFLRNQ